MASQVVVTAIVGIVSILTAWLLQPVLKGIGLLLRLSSLHEDLSTESRTLEALKIHVSENVNRLVEADKRNRESQQSIDWFDCVDKFLVWHGRFKDDFGKRRSNWNLFECGFWQNCKLAEEAKRKLDRARSLVETGRKFTDGDLVYKLSDMEVVQVDLQGKYGSLSSGIQKLSILKADKEARVKDLIAQNPEKIQWWGHCRRSGFQSDQVRDWFKKVDDFGNRSSMETMKIFETAMESRCTKPPALYCSSEQNACLACKEKYSVGLLVNGLLQKANSSTENSPCTKATALYCSSEQVACAACKERYRVGKEVKGLLQEAEDLKTEGGGFTDEQLIIAIPEMVVVLSALQANLKSLSSETQRLKNLKKDKEAKAYELVLQRRWTKVSNVATGWFRESFVEESQSCLATSSDSSCTTASSSNRAYASCSSPAEACADCVGKYSLGKKIVGLLEQGRSLMEEGRRFTDEEQLVVFVPPDVAEEIPIDFHVFGQHEKLKEVVRKIEEEGVNKVGIWGMGGIGKTTLLQRINNHFSRNGPGGFDVILYATACKEGWTYRGCRRKSARGCVCLFQEIPRTMLIGFSSL